MQCLRPGRRLGAGADRPNLRQEGRQDHCEQRRALRCWRRLGRSPSRFQIPHPGAAQQPGTDRHQRQHRHRVGRDGLGHGHLRDVPDHARHLGVALSERGVRKSRRPGAPSRGRDRRLRIRIGRVLRWQMRGDHHLGSGLLAQARGHRPGGDGRDPAGGGQCPAWRPEHWPADQGRAGGRAGGDFR